MRKVFHGNRWFCNDCGKEFEDEELIRVYEPEDGFAPTVYHLCPECRSMNVEEMDDCPTCNGWKKAKANVCKKCHLRLKSDLQWFARKHSPAELSELDDMLDGTGLELFT